MKILSVKANLKGGYDVDVDGSDPISLELGGNSDAHVALTKWFKDGNKADAYKPNLAEAKATASTQVERQFSGLMVLLTGSASIEERDTWAIKETAARAHTAGEANPSQAAMLASEAGAVGEDVEALAANIIGKAEAFYALVGAASGMKRAAHKAIQNAKSISALETALAALADQRDAAVAAISA